VGKFQSYATARRAITAGRFLKPGEASFDELILRESGWALAISPSPWRGRRIDVCFPAYTPEDGKGGRLTIYQFSAMTG